jgi:hypothetical protein
MMHSDPVAGFGSLLGEEPDEDLDDEIAAAGEFSSEEQGWLRERLDADEDLDELEKALLAFIAEETGELFGMAA